VQKIGEEEKELTLRDADQLIVAVFEKGKRRNAIKKIFGLLCHNTNQEGYEG
jgi:hypothetical protein